MDPERLEELRAWLMKSDTRDFAATVIRHGHVVFEVERKNSAKTDARRVADVPGPGVLVLARLRGAVVFDAG